MKRHAALAMIALLALGSIVAPSVASVAGAQNASPVAQSLIDMEHAWAKASKAADPEALAPLLAENFVALDSDGTMRNKVESLARTKKAKWVTNEISDLKVSVHGDAAAVVTGAWAGKGTDGAGVAVDAKERWADTWVKMSDGKWQCVASASAPSKK
jgi:ketosteroid isomerase-like protein